MFRTPGILCNVANLSIQCAVIPHGKDCVPWFLMARNAMSWARGWRTTNLRLAIRLKCWWIYYNQQCTINIVKYISQVSLCNLHCYMFWHFTVIITQFTTNALLSYICSANCSCW